jgi:hypothetical protein
MEGKPETAQLQPSHTLYVRNLNDKIKIEGKRRLILTRFRDAKEPLPFVFNSWRSDLS